ncbi:MAG: signal peptide peptidase SppA [Phycisphaerales bacterium]
MKHARTIAVLLPVVSFLSGCMPTSVTFNFGVDDGKLNAAKVMTEPGASVNVAVIDVRGLIVDAPRPGLLTSQSSPVDDLVSRLNAAESDPSIKAVILRIDSPGGTVSASDTMYREVRRFAEQSHKPVVASLGEVAASGGYYLALAADHIVAQPTSITASIGVIMPTMNFSEGMSRIGITSRSIKSGANKDLANPFEPMRESQYAILQAMIDEFYHRFRSLVEQRRPDLRANVDELTDGRVVTGANAVTVGLADSEGNLRDAFERAKQLAGVRHANLIKFHPKNSPTPRSAYAATPRMNPDAPAGSVQTGLVNIDLGSLPLDEFGAAYYLWRP